MLEKKFFEKTYERYNKESFIYTDPLQFPKKFKDKKDIEISALLSSSLAYGNVKQIIKSLQKIFEKLKKPYEYLILTPEERIKKDFIGFKHRFTKGPEIANMILNLKDLYRKYDSMEKAFLKHVKKEDENIYPATIRFLKEFSIRRTPTLIPDPEKKSAFKRFNLFLRWLVRKDEVDMGIWENIPPSFLIIPLDTHMLNISRKLGITKRKDNSIVTALEITNYFKKINSKDPVKYDFSLTRAPILKRF